MQESGFSHPFAVTGKPNHWQTFSADGFDQPVCGCVYDGSRLCDGLPLGGLGTGYVTLEGTGHLGKGSLFNHFPKPHNFDTPFIGLTIGNELRVISLKPPQGTEGVRAIYYWGHFPFADLRVDLGSPLQLGIRAFTPFILGNADSSNIPAALFEIYLYNAGQTELSGRLAFSFPGRQKELSREGEAPVSPVIERRCLKDEWLGVEVFQKRGTGYAIATSVRREVQCTSHFGEGEGDWCDLLHDEIRPVKRNDVGASVVVDYRLLPQEESSVRFVLSWFYPYFCDTTREPHTHHYARNFSSAGQVVQFGLTHFDMLTAKSLSWQREIYQSDFPIWLKDLLVNSLYSYAKNTLWVVSDRPDNWYPEVGFFTHSESFTGCPITETMVCRMHGHLPTLFFFPELEYSTLYAFKHFQITDGEIPFSFGDGSALRCPRYHCQHPLNPGQYVQMIYRYYLRTGDREFVNQFYESVKRAVRYQQSLDYDGDGLVNEHSHAEPDSFWPANQFYDIWPWFGTSAYVAGTWLATLSCAEALGRVMDDPEFVDECRRWLERGKKSFEEKLWNGRYYRLYNDPENGRKKETSLSNQLMVEWCRRLVGAEDILPQDHVTNALSWIEKLNFAATQHGLVNGVNPDGTLEGYGLERENNHGRQIFFGENMCAAMTFLYNGRKQTGLEIAQRLYEAVAILHATPWNQHCLINTQTGAPVWGDDYYSNLVVWALPMALAGQNISEFTRDGGLVDRILKQVSSTAPWPSPER